MATIGNISSKVTANSSGFQAGIGQASGSLRRFRSEAVMATAANRQLGSSFDFAQKNAGKIGGLTKGLGQIGAGLSTLAVDGGGNFFDKITNGASQFGLTLASFGGPKGTAIGLSLMGIAEGAKAIKNLFSEAKPEVDKTRESLEKLEKLKKSLDDSIATVGMTKNQKALFEADQDGLFKGQGGREARSFVEYQLKTLEALENQQKVKERLLDLDEKLATFGMSDTDKTIREAKSLGASERDLAGIREKMGQLDLLKRMQENEEALAERIKERAEQQKRAQEEMKRAADQVISEVQTPLEKYEVRIGELNNLLQRGAISWNIYGRAVRSARTDLEKARGTDNVKAPSAVLRGSSQAAAFAADFEVKSRAPSIDKAVEAQLAEAKKQTQELQGIKGLLSVANQNVAGGEVIVNF